MEIADAFFECCQWALLLSFAVDRYRTSRRLMSAKEEIRELDKRVDEAGKRH